MNNRNNFIFILILSLFLVIFMSGIIFSETPQKVSADKKSAEIIIERDSRRIFFEKNSNVKMPMASTTKIVTAITVIENVDIEKEVVIPSEAVGVEGSSIYLKKGETLKVIDLLYGLMLRSGNDAATALAYYVAGGIKEFALLMNETAKKCGAVSSNFVNPHGLSAENHYTTAKDLAFITAYALKNEDFKKIVSTKSITVCKGLENERHFVNKNKLLFSFDGADGVKTGYTVEAGRCLVSSATRGGMQLVSVVFNCQPMFERCSELMEQVFCAYKLEKIVEAQKSYKRVKIYCGLLSEHIETELVAREDKYYPLSEAEKKLLSLKAEAPEILYFPIKIGDKIGNLAVYLDKDLLFSVKLYTINGKDGYTFSETIFGVTDRWKIYENQQIFG